MCGLVRPSQDAVSTMSLRTPIGAWRATFFATLGLSPLVACSSSDQTNGYTMSSSGGSSASTGGAPASTGGAMSGGSPGEGGAKPAGGAGGALATGGTSIGGGFGAGGGSAGGHAGTGGSATGGVAGTSGNGGVDGGVDAGPDAADAGRSCRDPMPRLGPDGMPTGFVDCAGGFTHRPEKRTCAKSIPRTGACMVSDGITPSCTHDSDCTDQPLGYCNPLNGPGGANCFCNYGCTTDAECGTGELCGCADPVGACVPTQNCTSDADCGPGLLCISSSDGFCGFVFACQTPKDTCASSDDCDATSMCAFVVDHHECAPHRPCSTGRPFLVGGHARVASVCNTREWGSSLVPCLDDLDAAARTALATHWTKAALMEHASIAAFARFALELLSLGAPPDLLVATHAALADETAHARDAFALASAYAGTALGPGPLGTEGAMEARSAADIVETTVLEGCIGETVAALEAAEALAHATDPAVIAALSRVVEDETKHAELAFRFVRWALETSTLPARALLAQRILEQLVVEGLDDAERLHDNAAATLLARHGLLPEHTRSMVRRRALSDVVAPCLTALVAQLGTGVAQPPCMDGARASV